MSGHGLAFFGDLRGLTPAQRDVYLANQREFIETYKRLEQKHGHTKLALACAVVNTQTVLEEMKQHVPPSLLLAMEKVCEHMLTEWGTLAQVGQEELAPIIAGIRVQLGVVQGDIKSMTGEKNATPR